MTLEPEILAATLIGASPLTNVKRAVSGIVLAAVSWMEAPAIGGPQEDDGTGWEGCGADGEDCGVGGDGGEDIKLSVDSDGQGVVEDGSPRLMIALGSQFGSSQVLQVVLYVNAGNGVMPRLAAYGQFGMMNCAAKVKTDIGSMGVPKALPGGTSPIASRCKLVCIASVTRIDAVIQISIHTSWKIKLSN